MDVKIDGIDLVDLSLKTVRRVDSGEPIRNTDAQTPTVPIAPVWPVKAQKQQKNNIDADIAKYITGILSNEWTWYIKTQKQPMRVPNHISCMLY